MGFEFYGKRYRFRNAQLLAVELADEIGMMTLQLKDHKIRAHKSPAEYEEWKRKTEYDLHFKTIQLEELKVRLKQYRADKWGRRYGILKYWQVDPDNAESLLMACWIYFRGRPALDDKGRALEVAIRQFFKLDAYSDEDLEAEVLAEAQT